MAVSSACVDSAVSRSRELLSAGNGTDFERKLLISPKLLSKNDPPQIVKVPRSSVLDRLQSFLPQMAKANEDLRKQMEMTDSSQFDIENVEDCPDKLIEMNVAVFEMSDSNESGEEIVNSDEDSSQSEDEAFSEVTEANLKLPKPQGQKRKIEIISSNSTE
uniref:Uncharacterized protein n=1 Tax=Callorhinchus milii TaxID=7868 RepID=V9KTB9_CALMI